MLWNYFKKLNFIFTSSQDAIEVLLKGGSKSLDKAASDFVWLRKQFFPELCDEDYLMKHGKNRGVLQRENEPISDYRIRVSNAYTRGIGGGTEKTMKDMMKDYGFNNPEIVNLRAEDPTKWAEFRVESDGGNIDDQRLKNLIVEINELKPARSKLNSIRKNSEYKNEIFEGALIQKYTIKTLKSEII
ncbi:MAG: hypothetical protein GY714_10400 [Desulfobacterales bacterium]|nr:hypothetical protein [Desulfobacterales bacterium]